jgi:hypothetical protein
MERTTESNSRVHRESTREAAGGRKERPEERPGTVESLQRNLGNQAVQELHERGELQAKLAVSEPHDPAEREAEWVADKVLTPRATEETPVLRRSADAGESESATGGRERRLRSSLTGGQPLPASTQSFFEKRFGHNFSDVRVHTGPQANEAAKSINATAFTLGSDIAFARGAYQPGTSGGRRLLAHELTHVVQQGDRQRVDLSTAGLSPTVSRTRASTVYRQEQTSRESMGDGSGNSFSDLSLSEKRELLERLRETKEHYELIIYYHEEGFDERRNDALTLGGVGPPGEVTNLAFEAVEHAADWIRDGDTLAQIGGWAALLTTPAWFLYAFWIGQLADLGISGISAIQRLFEEDVQHLSPEELEEVEQGQEDLEEVIRDLEREIELETQDSTVTGEGRPTFEASQRHEGL